MYFIIYVPTCPLVIFDDSNTSCHCTATFNCFYMVYLKVQQWIWISRLIPVDGVHLTPGVFFSSAICHDRWMGGVARVTLHSEREIKCWPGTVHLAAASHRYWNAIRELQNFYSGYQCWGFHPVSHLRQVDCLQCLLRIETFCEIFPRKCSFFIAPNV